MFDVSKIESEPLPELETQTSAGDIDGPTCLRKNLLKRSE
jgi:hypothetical protein